MVSIGADHPLSSSSRLDSNKNTFISTVDYAVGSIAGITVVSGVGVDVNTIDFCAYAISVLLVPKACWHAFNSLLSSFTSVLFHKVHFALARPTYSGYTKQGPKCPILTPNK